MKLEKQDNLLQQDRWQFMHMYSRRQCIFTHSALLHDSDSFLQRAVIQVAI